MNPRIELIDTLCALAIYNKPLGSTWHKVYIEHAIVTSTRFILNKYSELK